MCNDQSNIWRYFSASHFHRRRKKQASKRKKQKGSQKQHRQVESFSMGDKGPCKEEKDRKLSRPLNLHPEKLVEGYLVKSTLFFSGWQKHLRFFLGWQPEKKAVFHKVNQKKNGCHALKSLRCFCHPEKNRVDFTGCPSNHFSGIRLNGQLCDKSQKHFQYNKMNIISKNSRQKF